MKVSFGYHLAIFSALIAVSSCQVEPISKQQEITSQPATTQNLRVAATAVLGYRDFQLVIKNAPTTEAMRKAFVTDVNRIYNSDMKASVVSDMAKCKIVLDDANASSPAGYSRNPDQITINNLKAYVNTVNKGGPVLMHELVHYYNSTKFGGVKNPDVVTLYNKAKDNKIYPSDSYILANSSEYIAMSVTGYFSTPLIEPFNRKNLIQKDPACAAYIKKTYQ